jgi:hypothetical protein
VADCSSRSTAASARPGGAPTHTKERSMSEISKIKSDQAKQSLHDDELDAVTGGMFNAFANFGDIKGECTVKSTGTYSKTLTFTLSTTNP